MPKAVEVKVVGQGNCPRCNAVARTVARRQKPRSDAYIISLECPKCKYVRQMDLMSASQFRRQERHTELMNQYKTATPAQKGRIMREVQRLAEEEKEWLSSL